MSETPSNVKVYDRPESKKPSLLVLVIVLLVLLLIGYFAYKAYSRRTIAAGNAPAAMISASPLVDEHRKAL